MSDVSQTLPLPCLVIDGSGASTFVGIIGAGGNWLASASSGAAPLESLFETVESVLKAANLHLENFRAYIYAEGPGSILGLRLVAIAIETWSRLYPESARYFAYNSLHLAAAQMLQDNPDTKNALILSDWKKDLWNGIAIEGGRIRQPQPIKPEILATYHNALFHLPARKGWQSPPPRATTIGNHPEALPRLLHTPGLLKPTEGVQLYSAGANTFQKWTAERHPPSPSGTTA